MTFSLRIPSLFNSTSLRTARRITGLLLAIAAIVLAGSAPLQAHHGQAVYVTKSTTLTGTVSDFEFTNPHVLIHIDAMGADGSVQHWTVETAPPSLATHTGWYKDMMKPGDQITYEIHAAKNGAYIGRGGSKVIVNGKMLGQ